MLNVFRFELLLQIHKTIYASFLLTNDNCVPTKKLSRNQPGLNLTVLMH